MDSQTFIVLVSIAVCVLAAMTVLLRMAREKSRLIERYQYLKAALAHNDEMEREAQRKQEALLANQRQLTDPAELAEDEQIPASRERAPEPVTQA